MTSASTIALVTPNRETTDEFRAAFADGIVCRSSAELLAANRDAMLEKLLIDARGVLDGGHETVRMVDAVQERSARCQIVVIAREDAPEPVARRAATGDIQLATDLGTAFSLISTRPTNFGRDLINSAKAASSLRASDGRETEESFAPTNHEDASLSEVVLQGVTRRFETNSPVLKQMIEDLAVAAEHDVTILLIGETGSGKTFLSNLIHEASPRRNEPFLPLACGALPRDLIESELFGHVKGSFTSAHADKEGKFLAAGQGTILLDEIDVLGPEQQVKLLRVIETGEFEPVGSNRTFKSQARLVVASNLDLQPLVESGKFRPDLYYRLNMLKFEIPPLRTRKVDIIPLARKFANRFQEKHGIRIDRIDDSFVEALLSYPWPGNVRELENVIQRAVIYCRDGVLTKRHLPPHVVAGEAGPTNDPSVNLGGGMPAGRTLENKVALTEREIIEQTLLKNNFSRTNTAKELGISRVTLYNKMKKYDMMK